MKQIPLTQGLVALVDDADYEDLSRYKWSVLRRRNTVYAQRGDGGKIALMHRVIMEAPLGAQVDHRDGNGLNNTRANLRLATSAQNQGNYRKPSHGVTSRFRGVSWNNQSNRWRAFIHREGKTTYLGTFDDEEEAARVYDAAARKYFGEFARPNFSDNENAA